MNKGIPHLVSFKPLKPFYFGSSQSFSEGFNAKSRQFPTQTTLLGCMRTMLLEHYGLLDIRSRKPCPLDKKNKDGKTVEQITGKFKPLEFNDPSPDLGLISFMSSPFIIKHASDDKCIETILFQTPNDVYKNVEKNHLEVFKTPDFSASSENTHYSINDIKQDGHFESLIPAKDFKNISYFGDSSFWKKYLSNKNDKDSSSPYYNNYLTEEIFIEQTVTNIARKDRITLEEAFVRKLQYKLAENFTFGIVCYMAEEIELVMDAILGGEQSPFRITINPVKNLCKSVFDNPVFALLCGLEQKTEKSLGLLCMDVLDKEKQIEKIVCLSPFILDELPVWAKFGAISGPEAIRYLRFTKNEISSAGRVKGEFFSVIPSGAVLYPDNVQYKVLIEDIGKKYLTAQAIGYNCGIIIYKGDINGANNKV
jgi:hypothetical protein